MPESNHSPIRVRFAPSPTGTLHVGGARTALFNWLFARATGGKFLLRIEDTDRSRFSQEALESLLEDLRWLGLDWDEGFEKGGDFGPYVQSKRRNIYLRKAQELVDRGEAYACFCSGERLQSLREEQTANKGKIGYDGLCRHLAPKEAQKRMENGEKHVIRLAVPQSGSTFFQDAIRGTIETENIHLDDLVLFKRDGFPTYHLASVVDDHEMKITHVLRGDEWISSTPKHIMLYKAFGWEPPIFVHLPVILAPGGGKLSKRKGAASVGDYKTAGYLADALFNFLALLGWNPGDEREVMDRSTLAKIFSLERIQAKSAAFDEKKLEWMNQQILKALPPAKLTEHFREAFMQAGVSLEGQSDKKIAKVAELLRERVRMLGDFVDMGSYFFFAPESYDKKAKKKAWKSDAPERAKIMRDRFATLEEWTESSIEKAFMQVTEDLDFPLGKLVHPVRLAVSGVGGGPGLFELLEAVGQDESIRRLNVALECLCEQDSTQN